MKTADGHYDKTRLFSPWNLATWHEMDPTIFLVWVSTPTLVRMNAIKRKTETSQGRNIEKHCQVLVKLLWETVQGADCLCLCSAGARLQLVYSSFTSWRLPAHLISARSDLLHHATVLSYCAVLMIYCGRKIDRLFFFLFFRENYFLWFFFC